jgi:hypothetical protein
MLFQFSVTLISHRLPTLERTAWHTHHTEQFCYTQHTSRLPAWHHSRWMPQMTLNCSTIRWWEQSGEKTSTRYQWLSAMRPWTAQQGHGHGSSLMAATLSPHIMFPVTVYIQTHRTCAATNQRISYFPQYYSQTLNGQAYRRLLATEVLEERPLSTAFWTSLSGRHPVTDLSAWTKFYSASQLAGQTSFSSGWDTVHNGYLTHWPAECKAVYSGQSLFYTPTPNKLYRISWKSFYKKSKVLNCDYFH